MEPWKIVPGEGETPSYACLATPLQKSEQDDRDYRLIRLDNGLKAVVVHDALADKAAACLEVAVGHLQDPVDMPGLAHFCEHMLSKGSKPFPAENDFLSFIQSNGGSRNAATGPAYTNYWFSVGPDLLKSALPRLAAFFHSPLFTSSVTSREINAVDSENKKNLQDDQRRIFQLNKGLSVRDHPWSKFGTGNVDSLTEVARRLQSQGQLSSDVDETEGDGGAVGRETRRRLMDWWRQEYCAGRMTLAILGKEPLEELASLTAELFSPIPNIGLIPRPVIDNPPWGASEMGTIVFVKTVKDFYSFSLTFLLPYQGLHFTSKPAGFISHFLGHEGPGSIYAYLKKRGWIVSLNTGLQAWNRGIQSFRISGRLTSAGFVHYADVLLAIYNYIALLRSSTLAPFHYEEIQRLSEISFRFKEKTQPHQYVTYLVSELAEPYPAEWLLSGGTLVRETNEGLARELLEGLVPEKGRVMLMAKEIMLPSDAEWKTEKWYGTQYHVENLGKDLIKKAQQPSTNPELFLPSPNPFIPVNLEVQRKETPEPAKFPMRIRETPVYVLWHKLDDQFGVPKAHVKLDIRSPIAYATPRHAVLTRLFVDLVKDALAEITYNAELTDLSYSVHNHQDGFRVSLGGYSNKLPVLMRIVLSKIKDLVVDTQRLAVMIEQLKLEYENFYLAQPYQLSGYKVDYLLTPCEWTPREKLAEILVIDENDVLQHKAQLLSRVYIESLVNGNYETQQAVDLLKVAEEILATESLAPSERSSHRSLILPAGANFVRQETVANSKEPNSSLTYYCHFGDISDQRLRPVLHLLAHIIREPCFSQLRTTEQLGYIVQSSVWSAAGSMGMCINVQSLRDPNYLEERVDSFLETFHQKLENLSEKEVEAQKEGLIVKKLERLKNLGEESARFWRHIDSGYYDFLRHETDAATIRDITLGELSEAYNNYLHPKSLSRRKLSIHLRSQSLDCASALTGGTVLIEDEIMFKASLGTSPYPIPMQFAHTPDLDTSTSKARL